MKRDPLSSELSGGYNFRLVWRGWFAGLLVLFVPIWALALLAVVATGSWGELVPGVGGLLLIPFIAAGQGVIAGALVLLGLRVWPEKSSQESK